MSEFVSERDLENYRLLINQMGYTEKEFLEKYKLKNLRDFIFPKKIASVDSILEDIVDFQIHNPDKRVGFYAFLKNSLLKLPYDVLLKLQNRLYKHSFVYVFGGMMLPIEAKKRKYIVLLSGESYVSHSLLGKVGLIFHELAHIFDSKKAREGKYKNHYDSEVETDLRVCEWGFKKEMEIMLEEMMEQGQDKWYKEQARYRLEKIKNLG